MMSHANEMCDEELGTRCGSTRKQYRHGCLIFVITSISRRRWRQDDERLACSEHGIRKWRVGVLVREVFLTGEVADEWAPPERVVIADSATEHGWRDSSASIAEAIVVGAAHFERDLRIHTRQLPDWVGRRTRIVTTAVTLTSRQESPASSERITSPVLLHQRHAGTL